VVLRTVKPCSILAVSQRFGGTCCLHLQGLTEDGGNIFVFVGTQSEDYIFTLKTANSMFAKTLIIFNIRRGSSLKAEVVL
jgi:hypothetical protein